MAAPPLLGAVGEEGAGRPLGPQNSPEPEEHSQERTVWVPPLTSPHPAPFRPPGIGSNVAWSRGLVLGGAVLSPRGEAGTCSLESDMRTIPGVGESPGTGGAPRPLQRKGEGSQCPRVSGGAALCEVVGSEAEELPRVLKSRVGAAMVSGGPWLFQASSSGGRTLGSRSRRGQGRNEHKASKSVRSG